MSRILTALLFLFATAPALAQELPAALLEAYEGYQRAAETNDLEAGQNFAYAAWQEGERAEIDPATLSILASNYAELASLMARHAEAAEAYQRAVELHVEAGVLDAESAAMRTEIARSLLRADQFRAARRQADANIEHFEANFHGEERELGVYSNRLVAALASFSLDNNGAAIRYAEPAIAYVEFNPAAQNEDAAYLALVLARSSFELRLWEEAAYYGAIASVIGYNLMPNMEIVYSAQQIVSAAGRRGNQEGRLDEMQARILSSHFRPTECAADDETCPEAIRESLSADETYIPSVPMFRIAPRYPTRAAEYGRQGYVDVRFAVDERGRTTDVEVVNSTSSVFESAAIEAVESWRYWPAIRNGEPIRRRGVHTRIEFVLAN